MKESSERYYLNYFNVKKSEEGMGKEMAIGRTNKMEMKKNTGRERDECTEVYIINEETSRWLLNGHYTNVNYP
jgi:hypothetical protein